MGTYDTRGGTPRHDPAFEQERPSSPAEDQRERMIEALERIATALENVSAWCDEHWHNPASRA
jgi:hypothetical protein